jgi:hypothetical protein
VDGRRKNRQALQRGRHRRLQKFGDGPGLLKGVARAPADEQARLLGRQQHFSGAPDLAGSRPLRLGDGWRGGNVRHLAGKHLEVDRDLDEHRSRLAEWAISQALNRVGTISAWLVTRKLALVSGLRKACWSSSCNW